MTLPMDAVTLLRLVGSALFASWLVWVAIPWAQRAWISVRDRHVELRREANARWLDAMSWSERDRPVYPVLVGLVDELSVTGIVYQVAPEGMSVAVRFAWWGRSRRNRARVMGRVEELLDQGVADAREARGSGE